MKKHNRTWGGKTTKRRKRIRFYFYAISIVIVLALLNVLLVIHNNNQEQEINVIQAQLDDIQAKNNDLYLQLEDEVEKENLLEVLIGTPMEDAIPYIRRASQYYDVPIGLFIGIANAESSLKSFNCYNAWGIGNNGPRCYSSWKHSCDGFGALIRYYYINEGLTTPENILRKYVGYANPHWVNNVEVYYNPEN